VEKCRKKFLERRPFGVFLVVPFWEPRVLDGDPPPLRIFGIIGLGENCKVIYGAQAVEGKILETKNLQLLPARFSVLLPP
jgi:hypothetical protein